jgi:putative flippase GtrA
MLLATRLRAPAIRHHRPTADRGAVPQPDAAAGRAAISPGPSIARELRSFATIGIWSTVAYLAIYSCLRFVTSAAIANALALLLSAIGNTAANRRLTFGARGRGTMIRDHAAGLVAFGLAIAITTSAVGLLDRLDPNAGRLPEVVVLVAANGLATVVRFLLLRSWIRVAPATPPAPSQELEGSRS